MFDTGVVCRVSCCVLLMTVAGDALTPPSVTAAEMELEDAGFVEIQREFERIRRVVQRGYQRLGETQSGEAEQLDRARRELQRLVKRLERWKIRSGEEPYRSNLRRFLRDLELRLLRIEHRVETLDPEGHRRAEPSQSRKPARSRGLETPQEVKSSEHSQDECSAASGVGEGYFIGTTVAAANDGDASCGASSSAPDVWFLYTAGISGPVEFSIQGSSFDTVLSLHSGCPGTTLNELACNDDYVGVQSRLAREVSAGEQMWVRVSGYAGDRGDFVLGIGRPGEIVGTVIDRETGMGLGGAEITVFTEEGYWAGHETTGASGTYSIPGLSGGTYFAKAEVEEYLSQAYDDVPCTDWCDPTSGTPIPVEIGGTAVADFAMTRGGSIAGIVTDLSTGSALYDVEVSIYDKNGYWVDWVWTSASGEYSVSGLQPGLHYARASGAGYLIELYDGIPCPDFCDVTEGTPIQVESGRVTDVDFALQRGGALLGTVVDGSSGRAIEDATVRTFDGLGNTVEVGWTDHNGTYSILGLQSGDYYVLASAYHYVDELYDDLQCPSGCNPLSGTPVSITWGEETTGISFVLNREGAISGTVVDADSGVPLSDFEVDVWSGTGDWLAWGAGDFWGGYSVGGLPAGSYRATTSNDEGFLDELYDNIPCPLGECAPSDGTPIEVATATKETGIDFALELGGTIDGSVTDVVSGMPIDGRVRVWNWMGETVAEDRIHDVTGVFGVRGLPSGDYFVSTDVWSWTGFVNELYDGFYCPSVCEPTAGTPVVVSSGASTGDIHFSLCGSPRFEPHFPPSADLDSWVEGCHVQIGGDVGSYFPGCPSVERIQWEWGDGKIEDSWLPADHWYAPDTSFPTITARAFDVLGLESPWVEKQVHLWDCLSPGSCGYPEERELFNLVFESVEVIRACRSLIAGPGIHLVGVADVTLAAEVVEIRNGVFVDSDAKLSVSNDPDSQFDE